MFDPVFQPGAALLVIWRRPRHGGLETIAAGTHRAMSGAWDAIQDQYPDDEITLQNRARIVKRRLPLQSPHQRSGPQDGIS